MNKAQKSYLKANRADIVKTVDGEFMVTVDGLQWGGKRDRSGAGDATFPTEAAAYAAFQNDNPDFLSFRTLKRGDFVKMADTNETMFALVLHVTKKRAALCLRNGTVLHITERLGGHCLARPTANEQAELDAAFPPEQRYATPEKA